MDLNIVYSLIENNEQDAILKNRWVEGNRTESAAAALLPLRFLLHLFSSFLDRVENGS